MKELSERTKLLMDEIPNEGFRSKLLVLFEKEAALYGPPKTEVLERVRFAVIRLALQGERQFELASNLYSIDTRDLLVSAEFADDIHAHEKWCHQVLEKADV